MLAKVEDAALNAPFEIKDDILNSYVYSYGGVSRFFRELKDNARIMATKCKGCGKVWCPPRVHCSDCYGDTEWVPLKGTGTVRGASYVFYVPRNYSLHNYIDLPYILGYIQLDGADTWLYSAVFTPRLKLGEVKPGTRVQAVFRDQREGKLTDVYFVPIGRGAASRTGKQ